MLTTVTDPARSPRTALVLAGGVAKAAFEAGAMEVLCAQDIPISRIAATSSGALNGVFLAAAIRAGRAQRDPDSNDIYIAQEIAPPS